MSMCKRSYMIIEYEIANGSRFYRIETKVGFCGWDEYDEESFDTYEDAKQALDEIQGREVINRKIIN